METMPETAPAVDRIAQADRCADHFRALLDQTDPVIPDTGLLAGPVILDREGLHARRRIWTRMRI